MSSSFCRSKWEPHHNQLFDFYAGKLPDLVMSQVLCVMRGILPRWRFRLFPRIECDVWNWDFGRALIDSRRMCGCVHHSFQVFSCEFAIHFSLHILHCPCDRWNAAIEWAESRIIILQPKRFENNKTGCWCVVCCIKMNQALGIRNANWDMKFAQRNWHCGRCESVDTALCVCLAFHSESVPSHTNNWN